MDVNENSSSHISDILKKYVTTTEVGKRREYAKQIKELTEYEGLPELYVFNTIDTMNNISLAMCKEKVDAKKSRILPYMNRNEFPLYIRSFENSQQERDLNYCEEVLQSRKTELSCQSDDYDVSYLLSFTEDINPYYWYVCVFKEILKDCHLLLNLVIANGCYDNCPIMNASEDIEYLCSCHPKTTKCSAVDYYYHNINFSTLRLVDIENYLSKHDYPAVEKEMISLLRRLYRLYIHAYYQHYDAFCEVERNYHCYEKFSFFVKSTALISDRDLRPYLSVDEMKMYLYGTDDYYYFRREKKTEKEGKKEKAKAKCCSSEKINNDDNESEEVKVNITNSTVKSKDKQLIPKAICEKCKQSKVKYFCQECNLYYCENCYETVHKQLQTEKNQFHIHCIDVAGSAFQTPAPFPQQQDQSFDSLLKNGFESKQQKNSTKPAKQHHGLRCKKCFELLVHDDEFLYAGGRLLVNPTILKKRSWKGLHYKGDIVYCCNEHNVGHVTGSTYANQGILFYRLTEEKITWKENYVDNPEFANSVVIQEKPLGTTRPLMPCELDMVEKYL